LAPTNLAAAPIIGGVFAVEREITSQPLLWRRVVDIAPQLNSLAPRGRRFAFVGCGTSYYMARACAGLIEETGYGEADAFPASEFPRSRSYDVVIAISRSGTTTEVLWALRDMPPESRTVAITATAGSPVVEAVDDAVVLDFADEESIVQTRFATTSVMLFRAHLGHDIAAIAGDAQRALEKNLPLDPSRFRRFIFLGTGWVVGLCDEAALKMREMAGAWCEAYPAMEFRHGPISANKGDSFVWTLNSSDEKLIGEIERSGYAIETSKVDPLAELVLVQRTALLLANDKGLDPDHPSRLTRSVLLNGR
jgi:fructoselysine-6-P-deglycase FrlB-like protein